MMTYWLLSENNWKYNGKICICSDNKPVVSPCEDGNYRMEVDDTIIYFDEEIKEDIK